MKQRFTLFAVMLFVIVLFGSSVYAEPPDGEYSYQYKWDTEYSYLWQYGFLNKFFNKYMYKYFYEGDNGSMNGTENPMLTDPDQDRDRLRLQDYDEDCLMLREKIQQKDQSRVGDCAG